MQALLGACLLWALISTGASRICYTCMNPMGPCLDPQPKPCEDRNEVCFDLLLAIKMSVTSYGNFKGCIPAKDCQSGNYSATVEHNKHVQAIGTCCNTDYCNHATASMPKNRNMIPKPNMCPSCYSLWEEDCEPQGMVPCTGKETQCVFIAGSIVLSDYWILMNGAMRGCATPNMCNLPETLTVKADNNKFSYIFTHKECQKVTKAFTIITNGTLPNSTLSYSKLPLPGR